MKISYAQWIEILNLRLSMFKQQTRVIEFGPQFLVLSNGQKLIGKDFTKFKRRVISKKTNLWVSSIDSLLDGSCSEQSIKAKLASIGGVSCQQIHGEKLKKNLNNGIPWNKGTKGQAVGTRPPCSVETKAAISKKNSGAGNGMYGRRMSAEYKEYKSKLIRSRILDGTFTPNSNNRNTHWDAVLDGRKYRSSWEALYQYHTPTAQYEKLRIEYQYNGLTKIYIVDFIDYENKTVAEIKPKELCCGEKFEEKIKALNAWAQDNGFRVMLIDKSWLCSQTQSIDYNRFDNNTSRKIRKLYEAYKKN